MRPFFLDAPAHGQRFCIHHDAQGPHKRGQVLHLHPLADEMNKSRRMAALQSRALAAAGFDVLQIDLLGCGDSSGDFGEATWDAWVDDTLLACRWLQRQPDAGPLWLWGLRAGCLVAADALRQLDAPANLLLVQPPASGKALLQQFLRLKLAGEMLEGNTKGLMAELRAALARGETVEVAGYTMNAALAHGLESAVMAPPGGTHASVRLVWLEVNARPDAAWTPVALQAQQRWRDAGYLVDGELVEGPSFWQTAEIEEAPALVEASCRWLAHAPSGVLPAVPVLQQAVF